MAAISETLIVLAWASVFVMSGVWSWIASGPFPMPGLRRLAEADGYTVVLQVLAVLVAACWLVLRMGQTRDRLLVFQGMAVLLFLQGFLYIGVPFGRHSGALRQSPETVLRERGRHEHDAVVVLRPDSLSS